MYDTLFISWRLRSHFNTCLSFKIEENVVRECRRHDMATVCSFLHFSRCTILVRLKKEKNSELQYKPGDHLAIFPANRPELVQGLIDRLSGDVDPDLPIAVEVLREIKGKLQVSSLRSLLV